jgi:hypothetical protein
MNVPRVNVMTFKKFLSKYGEFLPQNIQNITFLIVTHDFFFVVVLQKFTRKITLHDNVAKSN